MESLVKEKDVKDVICVHLWGALMRFPDGDGEWRTSRTCLRCKVTWEYPETNPEPETVIGRIKVAGH